MKIVKITGCFGHSCNKQGVFQSQAKQQINKKNERWIVSREELSQLSRQVSRETAHNNTIASKVRSLSLFRASSRLSLSRHDTPHNLLIAWTKWTPNIICQPIFVLFSCNRATLHTSNVSCPPHPVPPFPHTHPQPLCLISEPA